MKRQRLSKKDIKELNSRLEQRFGLESFLNKKDKIELIGDELIQVNDVVQFFYFEEQLIPSLKLIMQNNFLKKVLVDMPAVPFMVRGADVMRPGIKQFDEFEKDSIILIVDETHQKPLAIGQALFSSKEMQELEKGKVIKNLHWVGDRIWNI